MDSLQHSQKELGSDEEPTCLPGHIMITSIAIIPRSQKGSGSSLIQNCPFARGLDRTSTPTYIHRLSWPQGERNDQNG